MLDQEKVGSQGNYCYRETTSLLLDLELMRVGERSKKIFLKGEEFSPPFKQYCDDEATARCDAIVAVMLKQNENKFYEVAMLRKENGELATCSEGYSFPHS